MDPSQIKAAFEWGGWPAVFLIAFLAFGKWFCTKKMEQENRFHEERMKQHHAAQEMNGCLADAIIALVYKNLNNQEAAKVMADLAAKRLEAVRASERVAAQ